MDNKYIPELEKFTDDVCKRIVGRKNKADVKDELMYHLLEIYERNLMLGMDETEAAENAAERMGDKEKIAEDFAGIYMKPPALQLKNSVILLAVGLFVSYINLNFWPGLGKPLSLVGGAFILYAVFRLRKINSYFEKIFWVYIADLFFDCVCMFVRFYDIYERRAYFFLASEVLTCAFYCVLFGKLTGMCLAAKGGKFSLPRPALWSVLLLFNRFLAIALDDGEPNALTGLLIFVPLAGLTVSLLRTANIFGIYDLGLKRRQTLNKSENVRYAFTALFLLLIMPFAVMTVSSARQPVSEPYVRADTQFSAERLETARNNMLRLGFPEEYLSDLPDGEIVNYENAYSMEHNEKQDFTLFEADSRAYFFCFGDGSVRVLFCFEDFDEQRVHFRDGFYCEADNSHWITSGSAPAPLYLIISEKNGAEYRSEPIFTTELLNSGDIEGCEFAFPKGTEKRRAYFAATRYAASPDKMCCSAIAAQYIHKNSPLYLMYDNTLHMAGGTSYNKFSFGNDAFYDSRCETRNFEYIPEQHENHI